MHKSRLIREQYEIGDLIAEGMSGAVYRGVDRSSQRPVAIKALKPEIVSGRPQFIERLRHEAEALRQLNHPSIVHYIDLVEQDDTYYLIMEYVEGGSLYDRLQQREPCSLHFVLEIGLDLSDALTRAHRLGIIHRDLKPQNVLLASDGTARLSDFGIAHRIMRRREFAPETLAGTFVYMPPEAFLGEPIDERTDIWGLGVLLYEMLAGRLPFQGETTAALLAKVINEPAPDLRTLRPGLPDALYDLVSLMLNKAPEARMPSVRLVGAALEAISVGQEAMLPRFDGPIRRAAVTSNLPEQPTTFVGRAHELAELEALLADPGCRLVTLTGPGGVGKTRLAVQAAQQLVPQYKEGVYYVALASITSPDLVAGRIAAVLGVQAGDESSLVSEMGAFLQGRRCLLLLDNFEHVITAASIVAQLGAVAPQVDIMVTSRELLRVHGERQYVVRPLLLPDPVDKLSPDNLAEIESVSLFLQRAQAVDPSFQLTPSNAGEVAEICVRLDGLPLAIELAAARIRLFPPATLLKGLGNILGTLTGGPRDQEARHQTLRAAIDWSYELLADEEKRLFNRLAVFQAGGTVPAIEFVCLHELDAEILSGLDSLHSKSLLVRGDDEYDGPRFDFLETVRQYAAEKLAMSDEDDVTRERHAEFYAGLAEDTVPKLHGPDQALYLRVIRLETDNLRAALTWTLLGANPVLGLRLAGALADFWYYEGSAVEGYKWLTMALPWLDDAPPPVKATVLNGAGMVAYALGKFGEGIRWNRQALATAKEVDDKSNWAWALFWLSAQATVDSDDYEKGVALCEQALALFEEVGDSYGLAWGYNQMGELDRLTGKHDDAEAAYRRSLEICRQTGNSRREAIALINLGYVAQHRGDYKEAETCMLEGLALLYQLKLAYHGAIVLATLSGPVAAQGAAGKAAVLLGASEAAFESLGFTLQPADKVEIDRYIALVREQLATGDFEAAWANGREMTFDQAVAFAFTAGISSASPVSR